MEKENKKREFTLTDVIKLIGVIAIITPLLLGYFQYQRSVKQDKDNNFRAVVEKLSSEKKNERLAAATSLGTYLNLDDDYYEEALDILINTISIEFDSNVLYAIRGSLAKVETSEWKRITQHLLNMDRDLFNFNYALGTWLENAKRDLQLSIDKIRWEETLLLNKSSDIDKIILESLVEDLKTKTEIKINIEKDYNELSIHQLLLTNFITLSLSFTRSNPIENLEFYQNSFNYLVWSNLNIPNSIMENSAFSLMTLSNVDLSRSEIIGTSFAHSTFSNCSFAESEITASNFNDIVVEDEIDFSGAKFDDVFFLGANLKNSNFTGAVGLKPIYFYKVKYLEEAQFDSDFRSQLENSFITDEQFKEYVYNCKLIKLRQDELLDVLYPPPPY